MRLAPLALALSLVAAPSAAQPEILDAKTGAPLAGFDALAERARQVDLIVMGEVHDNPAHQEMQARLARALDLRAVAFEMVPRAAEQALAELRAADAPTDAMREAAQWDRYAPWHVVLEAVPEAVAIGAGVSRDDLARAMTDGPAAAFDGDAGLWSIDAPLSGELQQEMEAEQMTAHCDALPEEMLPGMVSAQRLRDAAFAEALIRARKAAEGGPAMLVTGNGHARRDRGVPAYLATAHPDLSVLVIGQVERGESATGWSDAAEGWRAQDGSPLFDLVVVADPAPREDPCEKFLRERKGG